MLEKKINIGVIGLGYAKNILIPAIESTKLFNIIGVANSKDTYESVELIGKQYNKFPKEDLIQNPEVELIVISTPSRFHFEITTKAIAARKRVFCEKPFGNQNISRKDITNLSLNSKDRIYIGYQFRFDPMILELRNVLRNFPASENMEVNVIWNSSGGKRFLEGNFKPEGIWREFGCHVFDYLNFLGSTKAWGSLQVVKSGKSCQNHHPFPDLCDSVSLKGNNVSISVAICRLSDSPSSHAIVVSLKNQTIFSCEQKFPFTLENFSTNVLDLKELISVDRRTDIRLYDETQQFTAIWQEINGSLKDDNLADIESALDVHDIIQQIAIKRKESE